MSRAIVTIAMLLTAAGTMRSSQDVYPPLTREILVGTWEGVIGIGTHPVIFHIVIAPKDGDSYLSEIYPDSMQGTVYRMDSCTVTDGKVKLHFRSIRPGDDAGWWFDGEGFGDGNRAWIWAHVGTDLDKPRSGPRSFYLEKGTWVRRLGEASMRAAEKITEVRDGRK